MNRTELQQLAEERVRDAEALLKAGQWSGAYYLIGYAAELGLKSCIAKLVNEHDFPDKKLALRCYTHEMDVLVDVAELGAQRKTDMTGNPIFAKNWQIVKDWDEESRYKLWTELEARELFLAVTDATNGVLPWIRLRW